MPTIGPISRAAVVGIHCVLVNCLLTGSSAVSVVWLGGGQSFKLN